MSYVNPRFRLPLGCRQSCEPPSPERQIDGKLEVIYCVGGVRTPPCGVPRSLRRTDGGFPSREGSTTGALSHCLISPKTEPSTTRIRTQAISLSHGIVSK